jgi:hypothetical protein
MFTTIIKSKTMLAIIVILFVAQAIVFIAVGRLVTMEEAKIAAGADLEEKAYYSVATGKPLVFEHGRVGIIMDTKTAQNGTRIAFRVISFVMPEDVELHWTQYPRDVISIHRPATYKKKKAKTRTRHTQQSTVSSMVSTETPS